MATRSRCDRCKITIHNLKNNLCALVGMLDLVKEGEFPFKVLEDAINGGMRSIHELEELSEERDKCLPVSDVSTFKVSENLMLKLVAEAGMKLEFCILAKDSVKWLGELEQEVIEEIFHNAKKAGAKKMIVNISKREKYVMICFRDDGKGMSPSIVRNLGFGVTTSEGGKGVALVRSRITAMGGTVSWGSIQDFGTDVLIKFKLLEEGVK